MKKEYSIWISIVSLLLSVIAVCVAVWRSPELDFDYQGVLVGVLSLLVTVLIGWQIYSIVDFNRKIADIERKSDILQKISDNSERINLINKSETEQCISLIYYHLLGFSKHIPLEYEYISHAIESIIYASMLKNYNLCNITVDVILSSIKEPETIVIGCDYKKRLLVSMNNIKSTEKINRFEELLDFILRIKTS